MGKHTIEELQQMQAAPLSVKIRMSERRIRDWVDYYGLEGCYVSFSGGKDSLALLNIARNIFPGMKAMFVNTSLEYPEIVKFVKSFDNVDILKPKMNYVDVIKKYGYPIISKEVAECVYGARRYLTQVLAENDILVTDRQTVLLSLRTNYWNRSISKQSNKANIICTNTKRTEYLELADRESRAKIRGWVRQQVA